MDKRPILLVEDNPDDVALTMRAFKKAGIANPIVVARDGVEALDWLFVQGSFAHRDPSDQGVVHALLFEQIGKLAKRRFLGVSVRQAHG